MAEAIQAQDCRQVVDFLKKIAGNRKSTRNEIGKNKENGHYWQVEKAHHDLDQAESPAHHVQVAEDGKAHRQALPNWG